MKCRKNTESKNPEVTKSKNGRIMLYQNVQCVIAKKLKFIKQRGAIALWSRLEIKAPLTKISLVVPLLF